MAPAVSCFSQPSPPGPRCVGGCVRAANCRMRVAGCGWPDADCAEARARCYVRGHGLHHAGVLQ
eukprot:10853937-Heterocapsa_arctica.AAC.1